ncbi:MAG: Ig-like domain-containing protein [Prevotella sp.]|jgi:hypothetical protein|nr:Ig-like domain-containing protein [Prevotella sp.]
MKKNYNCVLSASIGILLMFLPAVQLSAVTPRVVLDDLINNKLNTCIDYDGVYGSQCVDLVKYVCGTYFNHTISGNANSYDQLSKFPAGSQKIPYYDSFVAQPGDIFVFITKTNGSCWGLVDGVCYGHTGIIESGDEANIKTLETNAGGAACPGGGGALGRYTRDNSNIFCVIRLPWTFPEAIVSAVTPENTTSVSTANPLTLTFSHKMNKPTVEAAISLSPTAATTCSWTDDYTLNVNISQLQVETAYKLTIDGSIARSADTNGRLDGDKDGAAGGNYVLRFTTAGLDATAPTVVSYDPADGSQPEQLRPIVRIQFSEPLNEAAIAPTQISVTGSNGQSANGVQQYAAVSKTASVLHYLFTSNLTAGETYTVTLKKDGLTDLAGNAIDLTGDLTFSFTARPREVTDVALIDDFATISSWPGDLLQNSGTNKDMNNDVTKPSLSSVTATAESASSMKLAYQWTAASGVIRFNKLPPYTPKFAKNADNTLRLYLFGDGSGSKVRFTVRTDQSGTIWSCPPITVDWAGWKLISWNLSAGAGEVWLNTGTEMPDGTDVNFNAIGLSPADNISYSPGFLIFDDIKVVKIGGYLNTEILGATSDNDIKISVGANSIYLSSENVIGEVSIYSLAGVKVKTAMTGLTSCEISTRNLAKGVYILKVGNCRRKFIKE